MTRLTPLPEGLELSERYVTLRNDLVVASHGLKTLAEQRIVKSCAAKLDSVRLDQGRYKIKLSAAEYADTFGLDTNTAYEQLKAVSKSLLDRIIRREEQTRRGMKVHLDHWVSGITYHEGEAWVELRFSHEATPYLTMLRGIIRPTCLSRSPAFDRSTRGVCLNC